MGSNPPVPQQDNNWHIRVAVLLSLLLQVLLIFTGPIRKRSSSPVARFAIWSCYVLAEWVAVLALGLLLNNTSNIGAGGNGSSSSSISDLKSGAGGTATSANSCGSSSIIFAFWTPFLLLHLGGQDTITGYSIEDNDLWLRHLVGLLFELFFAAVIFVCSLQSNPMIPATVLMFAVGIIKYGERTYSLYSSSVDGILANIFGDPDPGPDYAKLMTVFDNMEKAGLPVEIVIADGEAKKKKEERTRRYIVVTSNKSPEAQAYEFLSTFRRLCFDLTLTSREGNMIKAYFRDRHMTARRAFEVMEVELNFIYDMLHTKEPVAHTKAGCALRFVGSACIVSSLVIFFHLDKGSIQRVDVGITYALLLGGLALDVAALAMLLFFSDWTLIFLEDSRWFDWLARAVKSLRPRMRRRRWSETISRRNLISYCLGAPDGPDQYKGSRCLAILPIWTIRALAKVAVALRVRENFDNFFFIRREPLIFRQEEEHPLLTFVFEGIRDMAEITSRQEDIVKMYNYRGRGVGVLRLIEAQIKEKLRAVLRDDTEIYEARVEEIYEAREEEKRVEEIYEARVEEIYGARDEEEKRVEEIYGVLLDSVSRRDFDESLLLWHIATDLCMLPLPESASPLVRSDEAYNNKSVSKTLSEYMLYLLITQPKMLLASAGIEPKPYRDTCAEVRRFFGRAAVWDPDHEDARRMLLSVNTSKKPLEVKGDRSKSVLFDACIVAKVLRQLGGDLMWEVVAKVWLEMLTYAAGKCKGSAHVQQLSRGGELITMVWLLMAHVGLGDVYKTGPERDADAKIIVHDH